MTHRIIYEDGVSPAPSPYDDEAWAGVLVITGGLETQSYEAVLAHWESQGVPSDDARELMHRAQAGVVMTVQTLFAFEGTEDARRYALTERAVGDALAAMGRNR